MPSVEILSLTASGIPDRRLSASIPFSSMALAWARAASSATVTKALTASSRALISSSVACVNSVAEISLETRRSCNSSMVLSFSGTFLNKRSRSVPFSATSGRNTVLRSAMVVVGATPVVSTSSNNSTMSTILDKVVANSAVSSGENFNFERLATWVTSSCVIFILLPFVKWWFFNTLYFTIFLVFMR